MKALEKFMSKTRIEQVKNLTHYFWVAKKRGFVVLEKDFEDVYSRSFKLVKKDKNIELLFNLNFVIEVIKDIYPNKVNTFLMRLKQNTLPDGQVVLGNTSYFPLGYMLVSIAYLNVNLKVNTINSFDDLPVFNYYKESMNEYLVKLKENTPIRIESVMESFFKQLEKEIKKKKEFKLF